MKRVPMSLQLLPQTFEQEWPCRTICASDADDLAILLYSSFRGTIDDEGEPFTAAVKEIERTFAGDYGRLLLDCSFIIEKGEFISSACLISWYASSESPFVIFTMTRPESKCQGMARFLMQKSINVLLEAKYDKLALIVTDENEPAQKLYRSLGFQELAST